MHREPVQHARLPEGEVRHVNHLLHLAVTLGLDLADLHRDQAPQGIFLLPQRFANESHHLASRRSRNHAPLPERPLAFMQKVLILACRAEVNASKGLAGRGIDRFQGAGIGICRPPVGSTTPSRIDVLYAKVL